MTKKELSDICSSHTVSAAMYALRLKELQEETADLNVKIEREKGMVQILQVILKDTPDDPASTK